MREFDEVTVFTDWLKTLGEVQLHQAIRQLEVVLEGKSPEGFESIKGNRIPEDRVNIAEVSQIEVVEWHDKPEPVGHPDCVAILFQSPMFEAALARADMLPPGKVPKLFLRMKTDEVCDEIIDSLITHRNGVWPHKPARSNKRRRRR